VLGLLESRSYPTMALEYSLGLVAGWGAALVAQPIRRDAPTLQPLQESSDRQFLPHRLLIQRDRLKQHRLLVRLALAHLKPDRLPVPVALGQSKQHRLLARLALAHLKPERLPVPAALAHLKPERLLVPAPLNQSNR
jgi:hypothetical protein